MILWKRESVYWEGEWVVMILGEGYLKTMRQEPRKPESPLEQNNMLLRKVGPNGLALEGKAHSLHPRDVMRVAERLNMLDGTFDNDEHSAGTVELFGTKVYWKIKPEDQRPVVISLEEFKQDNE